MLFSILEGFRDYSEFLSRAIKRGAILLTSCHFADLQC